MAEQPGPSQASATARHALAVEEALAGQKVDPSGGLTSADATARRAQHGSNTFAEQKTEQGRPG